MRLAFLSFFLAISGCLHVDDGSDPAPRRPTDEEARRSWERAHATDIDAALSLPDSSWIEPETDPFSDVRFKPRFRALVLDRRIIARMDRIQRAHSVRASLIQQCDYDRHGRMSRLRASYDAEQAPDAADVAMNERCADLDRLALERSGETYPHSLTPEEVDAKRAQAAEAAARLRAEAAARDAREAADRAERERHATEVVQAENVRRDSQVKRDALAASLDRGLLQRGQGDNLSVSARGTALHLEQTYGCNRQEVYDIAHDTRVRQLALGVGFDTVECDDPVYHYWWSFVDPQ